MPEIVLRPHQDKCIHTLMDYEGKYACAEVTVAGGKSLILGCSAGYAVQRGGRALVIAHRGELVQQNAEAMRDVGIQPGICSGDMGKNVFSRVTVGTVGTIANRLRSFANVTDIFVDEVHRVPVHKTSQYRKIFEGIPHAKVRGLTGTLFRSDGTGSLEKTFGPIIYRYSFLDALRDGYVKPLVPAHSEAAANIDTEGLKTKGEDFDLDEMGSRAIQLVKPHVVAIRDTMVRQGRSRVLVFACNIEHADRLEAEFIALGVNAAAVHSHSPKGKRQKCVEAFTDGRLPVLISVGMFDTGFNVVDIDLLAFCRATKSAVFFAQALGRGARLSRLAENCAVLDFGGNVARHGSIDAITAAPGVELSCDDCGRKWETWKHGRTCPNCGKIHKSATTCKGCTEKFDQFYHGSTCPHCGLLQTAVKKCIACEQTYAAFLHPMCPHCGYDNTSVREAGKDLNEWGGSEELVNVSEFIAKNPWQPITRPPFKGSTSWQLPTRFATVRWPYADLPSTLRQVYLVKAGNGHLVVKAWYDAQGRIHQL